MFSPIDPSRRFFAPTSRHPDRMRAPGAPADGRIATARDRIALGYYDQPALTEAVIARLIQTLAARDN